MQILILNAIVIGVTALSTYAIGESPDIKEMTLLLLAYLILQLETATVCFGISAFLKSKGSGIGLGIAALFYFLNILANLTEKLHFLKFMTPFGYAEGSDIIAEGSLHFRYLSVGIQAISFLPYQ